MKEFRSSVQAVASHREGGRVGGFQYRIVLTAREVESCQSQK